MDRPDAWYKPKIVRLTVYQEVEGNVVNGTLAGLDVGEKSTRANILVDSFEKARARQSNGQPRYIKIQDCILYKKI